MRRRAEARASLKSRRWHLLPLAAAGAGVLGMVEHLYRRHSELEPSLVDIWPWVLMTPLLCGALYTLSAGGAVLGRRIIGALLCGVMMGLLFSAISYGMSGWEPALKHLLAGTVWRIFVLTILTAVGAVITEAGLPEP
jgi:hypothetical protein